MVLKKVMLEELKISFCKLAVNKVWMIVDLNLIERFCRDFRLILFESLAKLFIKPIG